jgi:hypothetical protein
MPQNKAKGKERRRVSIVEAVTSTCCVCLQKALGKFYDGVIDAIDFVVEAYQGAFDLIGAIPVPEEMEKDILEKEKIMKILKEA